MQYRYQSSTGTLDHGAPGADVDLIPDAIVEGQPSVVPVARPAPLEHPPVGSWATRYSGNPSIGIPQPSSSIPLAGFGVRVAAAVIDFVILQFASAIINTFFVGMLLSSIDTTTIILSTVGPVLLGGLLALFYSVWLESSAWQATPGKMILGLKVVDLDGQRVSFGRSSWRNLAKGLSMLTLGFGYLMPLWTPRRQTLHDQATGCLVIRAK